MKRLVVYFSYTDHTKQIVKMIQERVACDVLELQPIKEYSKDYQKVVDEETGNNQDKIIGIKNYDYKINDYDEIIIGTPVWWYTMVPAIRTFLKDSKVESPMNIVFDSDYYNLKPKTNIKDLYNWIDNL